MQCYRDELDRQCPACVPSNLTIEGKRMVVNFQNLKAQCAFKLAELVETHRIAAKTGPARMSKLQRG
jgi:hypothetical protein